MTLVELHEFLASRKLALRSAHLVGSGTDLVTVDSFTCDPAEPDAAPVVVPKTDDSEPERDALEDFVNRKAAK